MKNKRIITTIVFLSLLATCCLVNKSYAASNGVYGTCEWVIDDNGTLTISASSSNTCELGAYNYPTSRPYSSLIENVKKAVIGEGVSAPGQNARNLFYGMKNMKTIEGLNNLDTSETTNMNGMFFNCSSLEEVDLSSLNTSNVTAMHGMFAGDSSLKSLDLSSFDTSKVSIMSGMFAGCTSLETLDLSTFNNAEVIMNDSKELSDPRYIENNPFAFAGAFAGIGQNVSSGTELILGPNFKYGSTATSKDNAKVLSYNAVEGQDKRLGDGYMMFDLRFGSGNDGYFEYAEREGLLWMSKDDPDVIGSDAVVAYQNSSNKINTYIVYSGDVESAGAEVVEVPNTAARTPDTVESADAEVVEVPNTAARTPDTGASTNEINATSVMTPLMGIAIGAFAVAIMPRLFHGKIDFEK